MATCELLNELTQAYAREHDQPVAYEAVGGVAAARRVQSGEYFDIVVLASNAIDNLIAEGKLLGERIDLVTSGVAIAVRAGASRPDISSEQAVKQAVLNASSLSYSTGPSGVYLESLFQRWGILADIKLKIVVPPPGVPVGSLVAKGDCELGFQQLSELMNLPGIVVLGSLPASIQTITTFSGAVASTSRQPATALRVLRYLQAPATRAIKQRYGMDAP